MLAAFAAAFLVGIAYGVLAQRSHFCTMGALTDFFLFGGTRRLRGWILAAATGVLLTQLAGLGLPLHAGQTIYGLPPGGDMLNAPLGGLLLGYGMVLAGGCPSRALVRAGTGSLTAALVLVLMTLLALLGSRLHVPALVPLSLPLATGPVAVAASLAALAAITWALFDRGLRHDRKLLSASLGLGVLVPLGWLVLPATGLNFAAGAALPAFVAAGLPLGVIAGAYIAGRHAGQVRRERPRRSELFRALAGGVLMGMAVVLLHGCTVGMGLAGLSVLAPTSLLTLLGMAAGSKAALDYLSTGRLMPSLNLR